MDGLAPRLRFRPFRNFLRQSAAIGVRARPIRQPFGVHQCLKAPMRGLQIDIAAAEQFLERHTHCGCVGMQWEVHPVDMDIEVPFQLFNTPGTEIAPRSNVIAEYFHRDHPSHPPLLQSRRVATSMLSISLAPDGELKPVQRAPGERNFLTRRARTYPTNRFCRPLRAEVKSTEID